MIEVARSVATTWSHNRRDGPEAGEVDRTESGHRFRPHPYAHPKAAHAARDHRGR
jgi:hypothetical protein